MIKENTMKKDIVSISPYVFPGIKNVMSKDYFVQKRAKITPEQILEIISKEGNVSVKNILSHCRDTEMVICRHIYCGILRKNYKYSLPFIARKVGRDHTTIMHATEQFTNRYKLEDRFKKLVDRINFVIEEQY